MKFICHFPTSFGPRSARRAEFYLTSRKRVIGILLIYSNNKILTYMQSLQHMHMVQCLWCIYGSVMVHLWFSYGAVMVLFTKIAVLQTFKVVPNLQPYKFQLQPHSSNLHDNCINDPTSQPYSLHKLAASQMLCFLVLQVCACNHCLCCSFSQGVKLSPCINIQH